MMSTVYNPTTTTTATGTTTYKVSKPLCNTATMYNGKGTTHKIRQQLNFTDEKRWKQFSSRRLELIDKFGLSERKASEQDDNIRQIANMLREEFNYPMTAINEFEKLVTAAVQSVRRNRKRSKKRYESAMSHKLTKMDSNSFSSNSSSNTSSTSSSPIQHKTELYTSTNQLPLPSTSTSHQQQSNTGLRSPLLSPHTHDKINNKIVSLPVATKNNIPHMHTPPPTIASSSTTSSSSSSSSSNNNIAMLPPVQDQYIMTIRSLCFELINIKLQSITKFNNTININNKVPNFLLDKIIHKVQNSRTFISFINHNWQDESQLKIIESSLKNLETLGEMSTKTSISFVIEKYFQDNNDDKFSIDFQKQLSTILFNQLFNFQSIATFIQIKFLYFIIGIIVKDYGFDSTLYPLNEIIHHLIQNNKRPNLMTPTSTAQPVLPPLNNGLNILSVVSSQVENTTSAPSPVITNKQENLLSVNMLMNNSNAASTTTSTTASTTSDSTTKTTPLPNLIIKESFANGTLPQPIQQIL